MLHGLQNLRAVAAYAVVLFHIIEHLIFSFALPVPRFRIGEAGVDLFFVLSGFVMVHVTSDNETPGTFLAKRIARIVPLYWVATTAAILLVLVLPSAFQRADLSLASILASFAFIPHPDTAGLLQPILFVGWTLNYEMSFYVLFAAALAVPSHWRVPAIVGTIAFLLVAARTAPIGTLSEFYGQFIILEFAAGCLIACALRQDRVRQFARRVPMWPVMFLAAFGFGMAAATTPSFETRAFWYGLPAALMVFAVAAQDLCREPARRTWLSVFGDSSYSAYILHPLVVAITGAVALKIAGGTWLGGTLFAVASLVIIPVAAQISYRRLEQPANHVLRAVFASGAGKRKAPETATTVASTPTLEKN